MILEEVDLKEVVLGEVVPKKFISYRLLSGICRRLSLGWGLLARSYSRILKSLWADTALVRRLSGFLT